MRVLHILHFLLLISAATSCSLASDFDYQFEDKRDASDSGKDEPKDAGDGSIEPTPDAGRDAERDAGRDAERDARQDVSLPCVPSGPDMCDGEDNDCDPETEDGADEPAIGQPCDGEDEDLCEDGHNACRDGQLVCDDDPETIEDLCDGEDNDCNPDTPDGVDERRFGDACDGDDDDLCEEGEYICEDGDLICSDDSDSNRDMCDGEDNDCDPDTPDGVHEPELGDPCDGPDEDLCEEDEVICEDGDLVCSNEDDSIVDICGNNQDEDCDGRIVQCVPELVAEFPGPNGVSSAFDVTYEFASIAGSWTAMCRNAKPGDIEAAEWSPCASEGNLPVKPFTEDQSISDELNGLSETQVRFEWENGDFSEPFSRLHYLHNSLHGVGHCDKVSEVLLQNYYEIAAKYLVRDDDGSGTWTTFTEPFDPPNDLQLRSPFIQLRFRPPLSGSFEVKDGDGNIEVLSLRRRFMLHPDRLLLLMFRVFESKRGEGCNALRTHKYVGEVKDVAVYDNHYFNSCDAVAFNRQGAGVCLRRNSDDTADLVTAGRGIALFKYSFWHSEKDAGAFFAYYCLGEGYGEDDEEGYNFECANNFMWRELVRKRRRGTDEEALEAFSPKCFGDPSCVDEIPSGFTVFLPDRNLFPNIFP